MSTWAELPGGAGTILAVTGDVCVAAAAGRLRAWRAGVPIWVAEVPEPNPARPTIVSERVLWGPYSVDLSTGGVERLHFAGPADGYRQTAHAWAADGSGAVTAGRRIDPGGSASPAAAWRVTSDCRETLWTGDDVPPVAVWTDGVVAVIGNRAPRVHAASPGPALSVSTPPQRIDGHAGRLLLVESGGLSVWDRTTGAQLARAPSGWMDACLTPDGSTVYAADLAGRLITLSVGAGLQDPVIEQQDAPLVGVASDGVSLLAAYAGLPPLRVRTLR